ncbi:MAG: hypothetical protein COA78_01300 [Blastopirellula sp.]|nr:MAG: hypothetical protein COA78_01300 [Blastopirellula sp.]
MKCLTSIAVLLLITGLLLDAGSACAQSSSAGRVQNGLLVLYDFSSESGPIVKDRSGVGRPVDLKIETLKAVRRTAGSIEVRGKVIIRSENGANKVTTAVKQTGEITIEAWLRPAKSDQDGPARIITLSKNGSERNFTLGQDGDKFDVRLRSTKTSTNGIPSVSTPSKSLKTQLTHVVYTRDRTGRTRLYLNGKPRAEKIITGNTGNWNGSYRLALANEHSMDRQWLGAYHLVALYNRDLSPNEVARNFQAGSKASTALAKNRPSPKQVHFETQVAPLLSRHCLECHDSSIKEGELDLSRKLAAFKGGENGPAITAGDLSKSLLWEAVVSDEMPQDKPSLSDEEKQVLKKWITDGATWTIDVIDPVIYSNAGPSANNWVRRLTLPEYIATVKSAVGVDISAEATQILPPDLRADGFSNTAYNLNVDLKHIESYAKLAEIITDRMDVKKFVTRFTKSQSLADKNMIDLIEKMGKLILRGPLEGHEVATYRGISTSVATSGGGFKDAVRFTIEAMLQSPRFIYRIENQQGDGTAWPVSPYELASRISYTVWGAPPDQALMQAADSGDLYDLAEVKKQVERMLKDPRAVDRSTQFISQWLHLSRLENMSPSKEHFPDWNQQLAADMREETLAFFKEIVWKQNRPLSDLMNAQITFSTPRLAKHYNFAVQTPSGKSDAELVRYDLSSIPSRGGLLTQGSVLTMGGDDASMVTRGLFVLNDLLFSEVGDPPPGLDTTPVPTKPGLSHRMTAEKRIADKACGGCHSRFEPLAFGLERFDGLGSYFEKDAHGNDLRQDGKIQFPGAEKPVSYQNTAELMNLLADSDRVGECITRKLTQFALGRPLVAADAPIVKRIHQSAIKQGGTYANLMTAIVLSDLIQKTRTEKTE